MLLGDTRVPTMTSERGSAPFAILIVHALSSVPSKAMQQNHFIW